MKSLSLTALTIPHWVLPWVVVFGLSAWILGARSLAKASALLLTVSLLAPPLLASWLSTLPVWSMDLLILLMWLMVLNGVVRALFGKSAAGHVTGTYIVRLLDTLLIGPLRVGFRALLRRNPRL